MISKISLFLYLSLSFKNIILYYANLHGVVAVTYSITKKLIRCKNACSNKVARHDTIFIAIKQFFFTKYSPGKQKIVSAGIKRQRKRPTERGPRALPAFDISASVAG